MLAHLTIKNFTIIDNIHLDIQPGMTVLTGETGAGKSIVLDALLLCLGARADSHAVRPNTEKCEISASFDLAKTPTAKQWLIDNSLASDNECILRRSITADGRSRGYINGQVCTVQQLRELGYILVNIHGQHEHQSLLKRDMQRNLLDNFAGHDKLITQIHDLYHEHSSAKNELAKLLNQTDNQSRRELVNYQVDELNQLNLSDNELVTLENEHKELANHEQLVSQSEQALKISVNDEEGSVVSLLSQCQQLLQNFSESNPTFKNITTLFNDAIIQTEEAAAELSRYLERADLNPERLQWLEQRLNQIYELARKHRVKPKELPTLHQQLIAELNHLGNSEKRITEIQTHLDKIHHDYLSIADKLTKSRKKSATQLAKRVTEIISTLGMPEGKLSIEFEKLADEDLTPYGLERIEFVVSTNPGQPLRPLNKVASGGELSRISLAIQVITSATHETQILVFDEVDVGVGGGTAEKIGQLLKNLGQTAQILCVTHLPQVAALGHHHFKVEKHVKNSVTHTHISLLNTEQKIQEIARMLGGLKITQQTLAHASEMVTQD